MLQIDGFCEAESSSRVHHRRAGSLPQCSLVSGPQTRVAKTDQTVATVSPQTFGGEENARISVADEPKTNDRSAGGSHPDHSFQIKAFVYMLFFLRLPAQTRFILKTSAGKAPERSPASTNLFLVPDDS